MRIITIILLLTSLSVFGQSESKILKKACRIESDSIFEIFIDNWNDNVKVTSELTKNDSLKTISTLIYDFYTHQINKISDSRINEFKGQYLIFDFRKIEVNVVKSDFEAERLFKDNVLKKKNLLYNLDNSVNASRFDTSVYFSNRTNWNISSKYVLEDFNCNLPYDNVLFLNDNYYEIHKDFVNSKRLFKDKKRKGFYADRILYYWIYPDYGTIDKVTLFSSGEFAMISYSSGSICSVESLYYKLDDGWKQVGKERLLESLSVRKVK